MRRRVLVALFVAGLSLTGCGDDDVTGPAVAPSTLPGDPLSAGELPPPGEDELAELFDPRWESLGLVLTRGSVHELDGGEHLALYVEPEAAAGGAPGDYLERLMPLMRAVLPFVFEAYPGLDSFDICQEPAPVAGEPEEDAPPPVTIVLLTRAQAESVEDWSTADLADLMRAADGGIGAVNASPEVTALPEWQAALAESTGS